ncbi:MAG: glycosyltransferase family 2 protein [Symploca sp. SIO3C6]|uniref:Glycosyltransferase family 2 protein n=1 Tax=Symploca sp. SIO1C4 TaxID=2607765 RepID=A0A6B3NGA0_9CYAN|nr:glycosyltransferase family 2 protein [Symploca sp. SIO3C6]NER28661.1 glycosyltransferase family 2 protein [Symploca sp. SIO1C4]
MNDFTITTPQADENGKPCPLISVAICTYNRADRLVFALDALCCQSLPIEYFEIVVIDNGSTDDTGKVCTRYQQHLPNLRYIYEPILGLSKARNTAMEQARGEYIAYLDDDAIPCANWLETIIETYQTIKPTPICVGGPIYPLWDSSKPDWITKEVEYLFSILDLGEKHQWLKLPKHLFGANMTYQREALQLIGGFSENLGRQGSKNLLSCEEYLTYKILVEHGKGLFYYHPQISVQHWISQQRVNLNWMLRRSYWQGRSSAVVGLILGKTLREEWKQILVGLLKQRKPFLMLWSLLRAWSNPKLKTTAQIKIVRSWGYIYQVWLNSSLKIVHD